MQIKIGIPRGLFYYIFIPLWEIFFNELGAEIVVSEPTNKRILDDGVKACVDEACLPVKLFYGHVINLIGRVDYILIPRFTSISRMEYICPKFGGLPDMIRHTVKGLPSLIDAEVNMRKSERGGIKAAVEIAAAIGASRHDAITAYKIALQAGGTAKQRQVVKHGVVKHGDGSFVSSEMKQKNRPRVSLLRVAVIGHPYTVYDKYISMDLLGKLEKYGAQAVTIEMVDEADIQRQAATLAKPMFWYHGRNAYGAATHLAASGAVDGIICVSSFGCGIDSFVNDLIERRIRREFDIPLINMTLDEHSGEAGFNTRLEAFIDMLHWRKINENNFPSSWQHLYRCQVNT